MRFMIVGVGQTFNFETKQMDDILQVMAPDGSLLSVPTTNEAAQALIKMAMNGHMPVEQVTPPAPREDDPMGQQLAQAFQASGGQRVQTVPEEDFPDGAAIFGGEISEAPEEEPMGLAEGPMDEYDLEPEPENVQEDRVQQQIFAKTQRTQGTSKAANRLGLRRNPPDRSGVPSMGIARVDEKGNPILPAAPDNTIEDEEDPGEQV